MPFEIINTTDVAEPLKPPDADDKDWRHGVLEEVIYCPRTLSAAEISLVYNGLHILQLSGE